MTSLTREERLARNTAAIALIEKWLAEDSDYDKTTWLVLKRRMGKPMDRIDLRHMGNTRGEPKTSWRDVLGDMVLRTSLAVCAGLGAAEWSGSTGAGVVVGVAFWAFGVRKLP